MTWLSNGFSRKRANLRAALALFLRLLQLLPDEKSIRMTPAMAAGLVRRPWSVGDLLRAASCWPLTGGAEGKQHTKAPLPPECSD
jgi:hypothetical protein